MEEFAGADGRSRFATTEEFLQRLGLPSLQELTATSLLGENLRVGWQGMSPRGEATRGSFSWPGKRKWTNHSR